ncbi:MULTISPECIES: DNA repair protein RadC [unclassified Halanaerobium]|uniref:RadC family protein n=1 Tax=unclassified Halanaerobium TaxID=2641197 RepID=UPI000DF1A6CD|nr:MULTISPECIES: DNA repair protein RadC [unclassified Halanaerobium]RCW49700.1 DNA replication and repair protein RadC [Halanaerobium sp. MA284_MarDTE_T2]RCW88385.1 DNA replication and repair protein RadC [Halanaerobium sp. DL-01]
MEAEKGRFTIKELPKEERPREKLLSKGAEFLSNAELLALIIRTGSREKTAVELAQYIINYFGGLKNLINLSCEELTAVKGVGKAKAAQISSLVELSKRISKTKAKKGKTIFTPSKAAELLMEDMRHLEQEVVKTVLLDVKNKVIKIAEITKGGLSSSIVHPRDVFKEAIRKNSAAIIMAHNHPSGEPTPSPDDIRISKKIAKSGTILGIELIDHIIIGDGKYVSLKEKDLI